MYVIIRENMRKAFQGGVNHNAFLCMPSARGNRNICAEMKICPKRKKSNLRLGEIAQSLIKTFSGRKHYKYMDIILV